MKTWWLTIIGFINLYALMSLEHRDNLIVFTLGEASGLILLYVMNIHLNISSEAIKYLATIACAFCTGFAAVAGKEFYSFVKLQLKNKFDKSDKSLLTKTKQTHEED